MENSIYKRALKKGLSFYSDLGRLTLQDLFTLKLEQLDQIAKDVNKRLKAEEEESFIQKKTTKTTDLQLALDILKDVIETKMADQDKAEKIAHTRARNERIRELIAKKQDDELAELSIEDLKGMLEE